LYRFVEYIVFQIIPVTELEKIFYFVCCFMWARIAQPVKRSDSLWAGWSGDQIPVGARFSAPVQNGPGAHPPS